MTIPMSASERSALINRLVEIDRQQYPNDLRRKPNAREYVQLNEQRHATLGEYTDRLPRLVVGCCPFTGEKLKRAIDIYDLDGPWWQADKAFEADNPPPPRTFLVLPGAIDLHGRNPSEVKSGSILPGPGVPFVVPSMLNIKGVHAVIASFSLLTGDTAYVISYWSERPVDGARLHQSWLDTMLWFPDGHGSESWMTSNDKWDYDLRPWMRMGKLHWIMPRDVTGALQSEGGLNCPFLDLEGVRDLTPLTDQLITDEGSVPWLGPQLPKVLLD